MSANKWTDEEKRLMREKYPVIGPRAMSALVKHSATSCRTMAQVMGLVLSKEAKARICRERALAAYRKSPPQPKQRQPFDDIPREYVKVQSIFRVAQRYQVQEDLCEA
jgi:hypothetical protein